MIKHLRDKKINELYLIGGDGTHRWINAIRKSLQEQNVRVSICGIPKTIDNDIP